MKLKEVGMKKALEILGAINIRINRKAFWHVSGEFTLNARRYKYGSFDLRGMTIPGSDDIDLNAEAPLYYHEVKDGSRGINMFDLNERFASAGVRVPLKKHEYIPWKSIKPTMKH